ncbi:MAG: hypothetical protein IJ784_11580 [Ruminiclostridium sp.]|nr:hypothetical protein [Ruminiclostridium sp.]
MGEVVPVLIGFEMIWFVSAEGLVLMIVSVILLFAYRHSKLPALITALLAPVIFVVTDLLFVFFNFTGGSPTALFDTTVKVLTGGGKFAMEMIIAADMVLTALSVIYSILVSIMFINQKKNKSTEEQKND